MKAGETSNQTMKNNNQNQSANTQVYDPTPEFLSSLAAEVKVSKNAANLKLIKKRNERSRILKKKRKQHERIREMIKKLRTTEAELFVVDETIKELEQEMDAGSNDE